MGKCLEFGLDKTPKYQLSTQTIREIKNLMIQPRSLRFKRELLVDPPVRVAIGQSYLKDIIDAVNATHFNHEDTETTFSEIAFDDPVDVVELMPSVEFEAFTSTSCHSSLSLILFLLCIILSRI